MNEIGLVVKMDISQIIPQEKKIGSVLNLRTPEHGALEAYNPGIQVCHLLSPTVP